jgi:hypothetical protein
MTRQTVPGGRGERWTTTGAHRLVRGDIVRLLGAREVVVVGRQYVSGDPVGHVVLSLEPLDGTEPAELTLRETTGVLVRCDELFSD